MSKRNNGYPMAIERSYYRELSKMVRKWQRQAASLTLALKPYLMGGTKVMTDADNSDNPQFANYVQQALDLFSVQVENAQTMQELENTATRFVYAVSSFSANKAKNYRGSVMMSGGIKAINPLNGDKKLQEYTRLKINENANLIKTMRQRYIDQLQGDIYRTINKGGGVSDLAHVIRDRTNMTLHHADLIATDQTGKILSQIDMRRNVLNGATRYIWRSMEDNRVRPKHRELDGREFAYDDPNGGDNGQLPGEPIRCRCYAEPVD